MPSPTRTGEALLLDRCLDAADGGALAILAALTVDALHTPGDVAAGVIFRPSADAQEWSQRSDPSAAEQVGGFVWIDPQVTKGRLRVAFHGTLAEHQDIAVLLGTRLDLFAEAPAVEANGRARSYTCTMITSASQVADLTTHVRHARVMRAAAGPYAYRQRAA